MTEPDPVDAAMDAVRVGGRSFCVVDAGVPWAMRGGPDPFATFHAVVAGAGWLRIPGAEPRPLRAGQVAVLPRGSAHVVSDAPDRPAVAFREMAPHLDARGGLRLGGDGARARILCGAFHADDRDAAPVFRLLPTAIVVDADPALQATVALLAEELRRNPGTKYPVPSNWRGVRGAPPRRGYRGQSPRNVQFGARGSGWRPLVARTVPILFLQVLRAWMASVPAAQRGALGALADPRLGRTLAAIHAEPGGPWTVERLAGVAAMSRSAFVDHFGARIGLPPLRYVTAVRMQLAADSLARTEAGLAEIASEVGYQAEEAFCRSFKRHFGVTAGQWRREARAPQRAG